MQSNEKYIQKEEPIYIEDDLSSVSMRKIYTRNGQRLELETPDIQKWIRLDAVELEAISWQDRETFLEFLLEGEDNNIDDIEEKVDMVQADLMDVDNEILNAGEPIKITNEYGEAHVRKVSTEAGPRCEIIATKLGYRTVLTATELESISWQSQETFGEFMRTPYGPMAVFSPSVSSR